MRNLTQTTNTLSDKRDGYELNRLLQDVYNRFRSVATSTAGLVKKAGSSALVKTGAAATNLVVEGRMVSIAAATDMPALVGTVSNAAFNIYVFSVDKAGTTYVQFGTEGSTLAAVRWPELDPTRATIGYLIINPTGTGDFVGGTSALDDVTIVPNAVYASPTGAFDPSANV